MTEEHRQIVLKNFEQGKRFTSTNQPLNRGRKKSRIDKFAKENNVSITDIRYLLKNIVFENSVEKLKEIKKDPKLSAFTVAAINAVLKDIENGSMNTLESMLNRMFGKPAQLVEIVRGESPADEATPEQREAKLKQIREELEAVDAMKLAND